MSVTEAFELWSCPLCDKTLEVPKGTRLMMCPECESGERAAPKPTSQKLKQAASLTRIPVSTTNAVLIPGYEMSRHVCLVFARRVYGINVFAEMMGEMRDIVGGRSKRLEKAVAEIENELLSEIRKNAADSGANAVIGYQVQFANFTAGKSYMISGFAQGTAVQMQRANGASPPELP